MNHRSVGTCNLCGGEVRAYVGPWAGVQPPPPPKCNRCGATLKTSAPVLPMTPVPSYPDFSNVTLDLLTRGLCRVPDNLRDAPPSTDDCEGVCP